MPEGDTIHHAAARLRPVLVGTVPQVRTPQPRHRPDRWPERLAGQTVRSVDAHGKHLFVRFEGGLTLHSHLGMTGAWSVFAAGQPWRRSPRRAWLVLTASGQEVVEFGGPVLELLTDARARADPRLASLGPDILAPDLDVARILRRLRQDDPTRPIGDALLDQRTVAGIGNVWKAESCFAAEVDPWRPSANVADGEVERILAFAHEHMARSAVHGPMVRPQAVYDRDGRPCPRCATPIRARGMGENNRTTFWCPGCQR
jgi:endonuclease-8